VRRVGLDIGVGADIVEQPLLIVGFEEVDRLGVIGVAGRAEIQQPHRFVEVGVVFAVELALAQVGDHLVAEGDVPRGIGLGVEHHRGVVVGVFNNQIDMGLNLARCQVKNDMPFSPS
jgi:hypothetical protein